MIANNNSKNQITIVGAGIIGLSQALYLLKNSFIITIVDKYTHPDTAIEFNSAVFDTRVLALTPQTSNFLQELGAWEEISKKRLCPYKQMIVWDGKGSGKIEFDAPSLGVPVLGHIVEQSIVLQALLNQVKFYLNSGQLTWHTQEPVKLIRDRPEEIGVKLADNTIIYSALLIAADGANSWVRSKAELPVKFHEYNQTAIVATVTCQKNHQNTAYQRFSEDGPLALLPLSDQHKVSIVWSQPTETSQFLLALSESEFNQNLTQFSESILGNLSLVGKPKSFVLKSLQAQSYGSDRLVLIGDSAHVIHPLAGLGANLGFQDVMTLSALISKQHDHQKNVGSNALIQRYYRERIGKNEAVRHSMTALNKLFTSKSPIVKLLRNWGVDKVNSFSTIKKWFANQAMGL